MKFPRDRTRVFWFAALLGCTLQANAQSTAEDPIDVTLHAALAREPSSAGQIEAIDTAHVEWEARLNAVYRGLQADLPAPAAARLRQAQRAWLVFREAEHAALAQLYAQSEGSLFCPMHGLDRLALLRHRVQQLQAWRSTWQLRDQ